ncbi:MAG TPA: hypothetical protein VK914_08645 [bacterium]|nr:hypothetical protein [bacterium]
MQGSNDLVPPLNPPNPPANAEATRRHRVTTPFQPAEPSPFQQAADSVQLSPDAVQAAANARAGGVQPPAQQRDIAQQAISQQAPAQEPPSQAQQPLAPVPGLGTPPTPFAAPTAAAPASVFTEKALPVQALASASAATPAKTVLQTEPEVRPGRVQAALQTLSATTKNSGAVNAQLAEKLLTEF